MNLSTTQQQFKNWLNVAAPELMSLWNWSERAVVPEAVERYLSTASHGQAIMCRFAVAIWFGQNRFDFDLIEAAGVLDAEKRMVIAKWFADPFWP